MLDCVRSWMLSSEAAFKWAVGGIVASDLRTAKYGVFIFALLCINLPGAFDPGRLLEALIDVEINDTEWNAC